MSLLRIVQTSGCMLIVGLFNGCFEFTHKELTFKLLGNECEVISALVMMIGIGDFWIFINKS
jgi:hypothetical protein